MTRITVGVMLMCWWAATGVGYAAAAEDGARVERPESYERWTLTIEKAVEGHDIRLHIGLHDGQVLQAWGEVPGHRRLVDLFEHQQLRVKDGRLQGALRAWVKLDDVDHTYVALLDIDARLADGKVTGGFSSRYSVLTDVLVYNTESLKVEPGEADLFHYGRELTGKASCRMLAHASKDRSHLTLWSRHLMDGQSSWQRYVVLEMDVRDGKATRVSVAPYHGSRAGWTAKVTKHDLSFDGRKLSGTVTFDTGGSGGTYGGTYVFTVDAQVSSNIVRGTIRSTRDGKGYRHEDALSGVADGGKAGSRANAVFTLELAQAVEGKNDLRIHLDRRGGGRSRRPRRSCRAMRNGTT